MRFSSLIPPTLQGAHTITCFTINTTSRGPCTALLADVARVPSLYPAGFRLHEENPGVLGEPYFFLQTDACFSSTWANKCDYMKIGDEAYQKIMPTMSMT